MTFLQMSLQAGVFIIAILIIRAIALDKLSKNIFILLWCSVLIRLLVPFSVSSELSLYQLLQNHLGEDNWQKHIEERVQNDFRDHLKNNSEICLDNKMENYLKYYFGKGTETEVSQDFNSFLKENAKNESNQKNKVDITLNNANVDKEISYLSRFTFPSFFVWAWGAGMSFMFFFFIVSYVKKRNFLESTMQVEKDEFCSSWLLKHQLIRPLQIYRCDRLKTPVAFGYFRPKILLPTTLDMKDEKRLDYILTHEYIHIKRCDSFLKLMFVIALCIHWFNPLVWVMCIMLNRDLELSCDELVLSSFSSDRREEYAHTIIDMVSFQNQVTFLYSSFSNQFSVERIRSIMKYRKKTFWAMTLSLLFVFLMMGVFITQPIGANAYAESTKKDIKNLVFDGLDSFGDKYFQRVETSDFEGRNYASVYKKLLDFQFKDYQNMSIENFRNRINTVISKDKTSYLKLIERAKKDELLFAISKYDKDAQFICNLLLPLLSENWKEGSLKLYLSDFDDLIYDIIEEKQSEIKLPTGISIDYQLNYKMISPDKVDVKQFREAIDSVDQEFRNFIIAKKPSELSDKAQIEKELQESAVLWKKRYSEPVLEWNPTSIRYDYRGNEFKFEAQNLNKFVLDLIKLASGIEKENSSTFFNKNAKEHKQEKEHERGHELLKSGIKNVTTDMVKNIIRQSFESRPFGFGNYFFAREFQKEMQTEVGKTIEEYVETQVEKEIEKAIDEAFKEMGNIF